MSVKDFDKVIYWARKGKAADSALDASLAALEARRQEIGTKDKVISIQASEIVVLQETIKNMEAQGVIERDLFFIEKDGLRQKLKKKNRVIVGLAGVVAILTAALVL